MSVLNKKPFIQSVLDDLDSHAVSALISAMNGVGSITKVKLGSSAFIALKNTNHGISHIILNVDNLREVTGYLIYNNLHCVFIAYDNKSNHLTQTKIDSSFNMEVVKEDLTIEELRQVCGDRVADIEVGDVVAGDINSENATAGKVLMADGHGGAEWGEIPKEVTANPTLSGSESELLGLQIGNNKYKVLSAPDVIASEFSSSSTYAVGDLVCYKGYLYECTTAVTVSGAWDSTKWTQGTVASIVLGMINSAV